MDADIVAEDQGVRAVVIWSNRPIEAVTADIVQRPIDADATTRSRVPDGRSTAELAGEVYTFSTAVISVRKS